MTQDVQLSVPWETSSTRTLYFTCYLCWDLTGWLTPTALQLLFNLHHSLFVFSDESDICVHALPTFICQDALSVDVGDWTAVTGSYQTGQGGREMGVLFSWKWWCECVETGQGSISCVGGSSLTARKSGSPLNTLGLYSLHSELSFVHNSRC